MCTTFTMLRLGDQKQRRNCVESSRESLRPTRVSIVLPPISSHVKSWTLTEPRYSSPWAFAGANVQSISSPRFPHRRRSHPLNRHPYRLARPRHHRPDLARQQVRVSVRNPEMLHCRKAVTMMVGTTCLRHPGAIYSPRNIQISRKCVRPNLHLVERVLCSGLDPSRWI